MKEILSKIGWDVSFGSERDSKRRETDILLRKGEKKIHIEVKHMRSAHRLYWSEREVSKAEDLRGRYFMVLLSPNGEANGYNVGWLWDPLNDLRECWTKRTVSGVWIWEERQSVKPQELGEELWQIPSSRLTREAKNFSFEIRLDDLKCSGTEPEAILTKLTL